MTHCIECGAKPSDIIQLGDNDRHVAVRLVKSFYGPSMPAPRPQRLQTSRRGKEAQI